MKIRIALFLAACCLLFGARAEALSKQVVLRLQAAARAQYADAGDTMNQYNIMLYRGKAYATTRGVAKGFPTIAVWEYVPPDWHRIFDYPQSDAHSPDITRRYRAYGFTAPMQKKLLGAVHPFPGE